MSTQATRSACASGDVIASAPLGLPDPGSALLSSVRSRMRESRAARRAFWLWCERPVSRLLAQMASSELAEDPAVVCAIVSDAVDRIGSYPADLRVAGWITQAAGGSIVAVWGKANLGRQHELVRSLLPAFDEAGRPTAGRALRSLRAANAAEHLWAAVVQLPPVYRMAIVLRDVHDVPMGPLAETLGPCGEPAGSIVRRARRVVAESLIAWGVPGRRGGGPRSRSDGVSA